MFIKTYAVGALPTNCYLIGKNAPSKTKTETFAIIDPGGDADKILNDLQQNHARLSAILLTHGHFDHILAVPALQQAFQIPVYIHREDLEMLKDPLKNLSAPLSQSFSCNISQIHLFEDQSVIDCGNLSFTAVHTPGHSKGSSIFLLDQFMFSGDTLFYHEIGRCDCYGGDLGKMYQSLKKIAALPKNYQIFPGHGEKSTLQIEKEENPYIRYAIST